MEQRPNPSPSSLAREFLVFTAAIFFDIND
jgi:hypothetical protein